MSPAEPAPIVWRPQATISRKNGAATASMILALIALLFNGVGPILIATRSLLLVGVSGLLNLAAVLFGFFALVLGIIGLVVALRRPTRKRNAIGGIVFGLMFSIWGIMSFASAATEVTASSAPTIEAVEASLALGAVTELDRGVRFECPTEVPLTKGSIFECTGVDTDGQALLVHVEMTDDSGGLAWNTKE